MLNIFGKRRQAPPAYLVTDQFRPPGPLKTAVLFLVFNRPDTTKEVFEAIRKAKPPRLYVACDGPREGLPGEAEKVAHVLEIVKKANWPCEFRTMFRERNLGCKHAVSSAIDWFFEWEKEGIILEDDCLPNQSFFWFCQENLNRYRDACSVMHIAGYKPYCIGYDGYSYTFTRRTHIWGWATWAKAWKNYDAECRLGDKDLSKLIDYEYFSTRRSVQERVKLLKDLHVGKIDTWDYQWNLAVRLNNGVGIRPAANLVKNIGHGHKSATHTKKRLLSRMDLDTFELADLIHPPWILVHREFELNYEKKCSRTAIMRRIKKMYF